MAEELISVILPVYNIEKYLEKCMSSLFCQTYSNLEFVIVDDGSAKVCADLCDAMAERDSRVVVYHKENGGLSEREITELNGLEENTSPVLIRMIMWITIT